MIIFCTLKSIITLQLDFIWKTEFSTSTTKNTCFRGNIAHEVVVGILNCYSFEHPRTP